MKRICILLGEICLLLLLTRRLFFVILQSLAEHIVLKSQRITALYEMAITKLQVILFLKQMIFFIKMLC